MLELGPVVSARGGGIGGLNEESSDGHWGEEGTEAEHDEVEVVLVALKELFFVPEGWRYPKDEAKCSGSWDWLVSGSEPLISKSLR